MIKFFAIEKNKIIRHDAFRFYYKGIKDRKFEIIPSEKITPEKVIKAEHSYAHLTFMKHIGYHIKLNNLEVQY